jgi:hypothetical protein
LSHWGPASATRNLSDYDRSSAGVNPRSKRPFSLVQLD